MTQERSDQEVYRYQIDSDTSPSRATYLAVAEATDRDPMALPPLMATIDTDALDLLVGSVDDGGELSVEFEYADCSVAVTAAEVRVSETSESTGVTGSDP